MPQALPTQRFPFDHTSKPAAYLILTTYTIPKPVRRYATEPAKSAGSNLPPPPPSSASTNILLGVAVTMAAGGGYYFFGRDNTIPSKAAAKVAAATGPPKKALNGEFVSMVLQDVETYNHNTKRFRLKLPEDDMVSGLEVASAILTKFKPEGGEKAVLRPYTPTSDEG